MTDYPRHARYIPHMRGSYASGGTVTPRGETPDHRRAHDLAWERGDVDGRLPVEPGCDGRDAGLTMSRTLSRDDPASWSSVGPTPLTAARVRPAAGGRDQAVVPSRPAMLSQPYDPSAYLSSSPVPRRMQGHAVSGSVAAAVLVAVAVVLRLLAIALCAVVVANAAATGALRPVVLDVTTAVTSALPSALSGTLTFPTILDGSFRGDIAVAALVLFILDWLCVRGAASLRDR